MKLKINPWRVVLTFIIVALIIFVILYMTVGGFVPLTQGKWTIENNFYDLILLGAWLVSSSIFLILSLCSNYYLVDKRKVVQVRMGRKLFYEYKIVRYIDTEWSKKHKVVLFYTDLGHARYLTFDKNGLIFDYFVQYSKHLVSKEEYQKQFPKTKM